MHVATTSLSSGWPVASQRWLCGEVAHGVDSRITRYRFQVHSDVQLQAMRVFASLPAQGSLCLPEARRSGVTNWVCR